MPSIKKGMLILVHYFGGIYMAMNIFAGFLFVIAAAAGIWAWWIENGGSFHRDKNKEEKTKEIATDEKN